jgi:hypothetical protein
LTQEIELQEALAPEAADEERKRVLDVMASMARAGKIRLRKEAVSAPPPQEAPAKLNLFKHGKPPLEVEPPARACLPASEAIERELTAFERQLEGLDLPKD